MHGVDQSSTAVVVDYKTPQPAPGPATPHGQEIRVGTTDRGEDHHVPLVVDWSVAADASGCLRVQTIKLVRKGGPTTFEIYKPHVTLIGGCVTRTTEPTAQKFERFSVGYCYRWNGAATKDDCAYSSGFTISADRDKLEGVAP